MKKILAIVTVFSILAINGFMLMEGGMASAATVTNTLDVHTTGSGAAITLDYNVQLTVDAEMSLTCDTSTVSMTGSINGMTGGSATGNRDCTAITNNDVGYTMTADVTDMTDVLTGVHSFTAQTASTTGWIAPGANADAFGLSNDDTGWVGSGTQLTVATSAEHTDLDGEDATVYYKAEVGAGSIMPSGLYQATSTISLYMN